MASGKFCALTTNLAICFTRKNPLECISKAVMMLYLDYTKRQVEYFDLQPTLKISKFTCISSASQPASLPAIRPGCARCRAPEISHSKSNVVAHLRKCCSEDDLPTAPWRFLLSFIPFLVPLYSFSKVRISPKVTIACNSFCLLRHTKAWFSRDIIIIQWHDVFACTLLHRELRDYSLGQIAFVFLERYLLSHSCFVM